jgi:hypothetical protein
MVVDNYFLDVDDVVLGDGAITISQDWCHEVLHTRTRLRTHVLFQIFKKSR